MTRGVGDDGWCWGGWIGVGDDVVGLVMMGFVGR